MNYLLSEEGLKILAMLPLFFSWVPVLVFKSENPEVKKSCLYSMLFSIYFFAFFITSMIINLIPVVGPMAANILHLVGTVVYILLCCFLIYTYHRKKTLDMVVIDKHYQFLAKNLF